MYQEIVMQTETAINELLEAGKLAKGEILVVGCSSSEIIGGKIGKNSVPEVGQAVVQAMLPILEEKGVFLAAQCCEHLNRALVVERECAQKYSLEIVCAVPKPKAGGSFGTFVYKNMKDPVLVEEISAHAGLDIGLTLIGMHLKKVAVPCRLSIKKIGEAFITAATTRPKFIGGERAEYK